MLFAKNFSNQELYFEGKNKRAVLIVHGFTAPLSDTDIFFDYFKLKNYTVARPILAGHETREVYFNGFFGPEDWLKELEDWILKVGEKAEEIFIIGISFGANLSLCEAAKNNKIKALILIEMPLLFNFKFKILSEVIQPFLSLIGIKHIKKNRLVYRSNYYENSDEDYTTYVPIKAAGLIKKFVKKHTKKHLEKINCPCFIIQAQKSDMLEQSNADYIYQHISSKEKEIYYAPINNHDLNLLDDAGKIIMLEKIYKFINKI